MERCGPGAHPCEGQPFSEVSWRNVTLGAGSSDLHTGERFLNIYIFLVMLSCEHRTWMCPNFISFISFHASFRYFLLV